MVNVGPALWAGRVRRRGPTATGQIPQGHQRCGQRPALHPQHPVAGRGGSGRHLEGRQQSRRCRAHHRRRPGHLLASDTQRRPRRLVRAGRSRPRSAGQGDPPHLPRRGGCSPLSPVLRLHRHRHHFRPAQRRLHLPAGLLYHPSQRGYFHRDPPSLRPLGYRAGRRSQPRHRAR